MEIIEGVKHKGRPFEIPDASRYDLPEFFKQMGYKVGAEIGVYKGEFTEHFCKAGLKIYGVDPWLVYEDYKNPRGQGRLNFQYDHAARFLKKYIDLGTCSLIRKTSMEALDDFEDESLDFVYIDANHLLKYVVEDIVGWSKKVRKGGVISGHDYFRTKGTRRHNIIHCYYAVNAYVYAYNIQNFYVIGGLKHKEGEKRDRWRSWMFFKDYPDQSIIVNA